MSFQGDVRSIGLAALLQGLARGRREGTLSLSTLKGLECTLGMADGKVYLLPAPEEDPEIWRTPIRDAWIDETDQQLDPHQLEALPHARRLEALYGLLDGEGVHFRFSPGPIQRTHPTNGATDAAQPLPGGVPIEHLLLDYARMGDELGQDPAAALLEQEHVLCVASMQQRELGSMAEACNGIRTLQEVADRIGWPLRQARLTALRGLRAGELRLAHPGELLMQGLSQLSSKQFTRAAVRIGAWCRLGEPGPLPVQIAERIAGEWQGGHLPAAFRFMEQKARRTLLRRTHPRLGNPTLAAVHWRELERLDAEDPLAKLARIHTEARDGGDPERPGMKELLALARATVAEQLEGKTVVKEILVPGRLVNFVAK